MRVVHRTLIALLAGAAITVAAAGAAHATSSLGGHDAVVSGDDVQPAAEPAPEALPRVLKSEIEATPDGFSVRLEFQQERSGGWAGGAPLYVGAYSGTLKEFPADPSTLGSHGLGLYGALPGSHWGTEARTASLAQVPAPNSHYAPGSGAVSREFDADRSKPVTVLVWGFAGATNSSNPVVVASAEILPKATLATPKSPELNGGVVIPHVEADGYELAQGAPANWPFGVPDITPATPSPVPAIDESDLGADYEGRIGGPDSAVAGGTVEIEVGAQYAGQTVHVFMFSEPTYLGEHLVDSAGFVRVKLAEGLAGVHRLAAYDVTGGLIGWQRLVIDGGMAVVGAAAGENGIVNGAVTSPQATGTVLAETGAGDRFPVVAVGALLLLTGAAVSFGGRHRGSQATADARHAAH